MVLKFSPANAKIKALASVPALAHYLNGKRKVYSFDLLSGWSCPFAEQCRSKAVETDGRRTIQDGPKTEFRCFSASQEVLFSNVYKSRKHNFDAVKHLGSQEIAAALLANLPKNAGIIRLHVAGDFFNRRYFAAWVAVAKARPDVLFYAYTKSLQYWVENASQIPDNFRLTASRGGAQDHYIDDYNLPEARVVYSEAEAAALGLAIDHDDSHAAIGGHSFGLLIHGVQPKGTAAAAALQTLRTDGVKHSYTR